VGDFQSILSLFNGPPQAALTGMTDWDRAFLRSLYATEQSREQRSQLASNMVREIVPDPLEQVIVAARQEKLSKILQKIVRSEEAFYSAYNKANTQPEYHVNCNSTIDALRMHHHVCRPVFVDRANEDETAAFFGGYAAAPAWTVVAINMPGYRKHLRDVVEKDPKLIAALRDYDALTKHYEAVRREKFKGTWLVWN
jgi:hypothetical protein